MFLVELLGLRKKLSNLRIRPIAKNYLLLAESESLLLHNFESIAFYYALNLLCLLNSIRLDYSQSTLKAS